MPHQCTNCGRTFADGSKEMLSGCPDCGGNKFQFQPSGAAADTGSEGKPEPAAGDPNDTPPNRPGADTTPADGTAETVDDASATAGDASTTPPDDASDQVGQRAEGEIHDSTGQENPAQRDARTSATTSEEIDEARRKMPEVEPERPADVDDGEESRPKRGRGTPQGPPTDPPDEAETEQFGLSGAVGPSDSQPSSDAGGPETTAEESVHDSDTDLSALRDELNDQFESIKITAPGQYELNLMELYDRKEYIISLQEDGRYVVDIAESYGMEE